jgi:hypothetical protein
MAHAGVDGHHIGQAHREGHIDIDDGRCGLRRAGIRQPTPRRRQKQAAGQSHQVGRSACHRCDPIKFEASRPEAKVSENPYSWKNIDKINFPNLKNQFS